MEQLEEYLANGEMFEVLGFVGVDGSPSCGVDYTCCGDWYGSFGCRTDLEETLADCQLVKKPGIFMDELQQMLREQGLENQVTLTSLFAPEPEKCMRMVE